MKKLTSIITMAAITAYIIFQLFLAAPAVEEANQVTEKINNRINYLDMIEK